MKLDYEQRNPTPPSPLPLVGWSVGFFAAFVGFIQCCREGWMLLLIPILGVLVASSYFTCAWVVRLSAGRDNSDAERKE